MARTPHAALLLATTLAALPAAAVNHDTLAAPIPAGPFRVACSNVAQDAALIAQSGVAPQDFWEGVPTNDQPRYLTQILSAPATAVRFTVAVPDEALYAHQRGQGVEHAAIVCHPTGAANPDADYALPATGDVVPHMQAAGAAPRLIGAAEHAATLGIAVSPAPPPGPARLPLVAFSHGLGGSPISPDYIAAMVELATHGFMVAAVFHGDARFSRTRLEDLGDVVYVLRDFDRIVEMEAMRPLALKAMVDHLLAHPGFAPGIDAARIGAFGTSMGGQAVAHLAGARITASLGLACRETARDPRVRAAVGLVPYAGQSFLPSFCDDQSGADDVARPYLAISGTADATAPIGLVEQALNRFGESRYLVALEGVPHEYRPEYRGDVFTWAVTFLNAYLGVASDPGAMARLIRMRGVAGGPEDELRVDVHVPFATGEGEARVMEFHNTVLDHYFIAAGEDEIAILTGPAASQGWRLTGQSFRAFTRMPADAFTAVAPVCRFYGALAGGPNSHFFTASAEECEIVKRAGGWYYEGIGFYIRPVDAGGRCPEGHLAVSRAYNNGFPRNDSNHRYTTSDSTWREMQRHGWILEATVMCALP